MSVQGELYRSYDSYVDGRMYMSTGSEGSVMQHQVPLAWPPPALASNSPNPPTHIHCYILLLPPAPLQKKRRHATLAYCAPAILSNYWSPAR